MQRARREYKGIVGRFRLLAGIDSDPLAVADFERITGARGVLLNLFSYDDRVVYQSRWRKVDDPVMLRRLQAGDPSLAVTPIFTSENKAAIRQGYRQFSGHWWELVDRSDPPDGWQEVTPDDIRDATGGQNPDLVFLSPPCKGFSGLLPKKAAESPKYWALNRLVLRGIWLTLEAFRDNLPALNLLENVPRILQRGAVLLREVKALLTQYGYVHSEGLHDCGKVGGLAQHRKRYLLISRHPAKLKSFVYEPPVQPVRPIGDELAKLALPGHPDWGPMHRLPKINEITAWRLALIPAGQDWRALEEQYQMLKAGQIQVVRRPGSRVVRLLYTGQVSLASDNEQLTLGLSQKEGRSSTHFRVRRADEPAGTVTGADHVANGAQVWADPRIGYQPHKGCFGVQEWERPGATVIGDSKVRGSNASAVADPRLASKARDGYMQVSLWDQPANTVTGHASSTRSNGIGALGDPRLRHAGENTHPRKYSVTGFDEPYPTVTGSRLGSGMSAIADPVDDRLLLPPLPPSGRRDDTRYRVQRFDLPARTVDGVNKGVGAGQQCVADPRLGCSPRNGTMGVIGWEQPASTVTGAGDIHAGGAAVVADPRAAERFKHSYRVRNWAEPAGTVTGGWAPSNGAQVVADPRGLNGIPDWLAPGQEIFISPDGTWHRPVTTLELAALQGFRIRMDDGSPLVLAGKSEAKWRERIGNAVPPPAAAEMGRVMLLCLMYGSQYVLQFGAVTEIWVTPDGEPVDSPLQTVA